MQSFHMSGLGEIQTPEFKMNKVFLLRLLLPCFSGAQIMHHLHYRILQGEF